MTENRAVCPVITVNSEGGTIIIGADRVELTDCVAMALRSISLPLLTSTSYTPPSAGVVFDTVKLAVTAPAIGAPLKNHWYLGRGTPTALIFKVVSMPAQTVKFVGCDKIRSGTGPPVVP